MALESSFAGIDNLNPDWPEGTDPKSDGDNHIRGVKAALKANVGGTASQTTIKAAGTARITVTATEAASTVPVRLDHASGRALLQMDASGNLELRSQNGSGADAFQWAEFGRNGEIQLMYKGTVAAIVASTGRLTSLAAPTADADAATKKYVDDAVAAGGGGGSGYPSQLFFVGDPAYPKVTAAVDGAEITGTLRVQGGRVEAVGGLFSQPINMGGYTITQLGVPVISTDAATKSYVDTKDILYLTDGLTARVQAEAFGAKIVGSIYPNTSGSGGNCGTDTFKWGSVYATNGTINTSDEREKRDIRDLTRAELRAARRLAGMCRSFNWADAGIDGLRHYGVIAQEIVQVLREENVYSDSLGMVQLGADRWGVNYGELAAFVMTALERELTRVEEEIGGILLRLERLEGG